jgi:phosphonopyruvate decarboxylase
MNRRTAIESITAACRGDGVISVATMQAVPVWHEVAPDIPLHIDMLGCMGSASSFALGLALGAPQKRVVVVEGDGSLMMQLGTLVTIGDAGARNLTVVVMHNRLYETSGNQPIPGARTADLTRLAMAAGFRQARRIDAVAELSAALSGAMEADGPGMLVLGIDREEPCAHWRPLSMKQQIQSVRKRLAA